MLTVKVRVHTQSNEETILPLAIPDLKEAKTFANHLHSLGKY
jgi:hypothetical protein